MFNNREHWNEVFQNNNDRNLGWYEDDSRQTMKFLRNIPDLSKTTVFISGVGTSKLADELINICQRLVLNDISDTALDKLKDRLADPPNAMWLHHDLSRPIPPGIPAVDLWIDRAVLHFLLKESQIEQYFDNLREKVRLGGHVLLAEFAPDGALKCAGLELHRYSFEEMSWRLGQEFTMLKNEDFIYLNPDGDPRPYNYALFHRKSDLRGPVKPS